ncbi:hypothetical protein AB9B48_09010 [Kluyvera ascorbata]|uniref:hypothetical protein n=1 Tax=Kluyvera ascorbata TaxID=51288 RepID=UPI00350FC720
MNAKNSAVIIERAKSVLISLIMGREQLDECTVESNLFVIQQLLDDASQSLHANKNENLTDSKSIDFIDDILNAITTAKKTEELARIYVESYFTDKDNNNPCCFMADAIHDYAHKLRTELSNIEIKLIP